MGSIPCYPQRRRGGGRRVGLGAWQGMGGTARRQRAVEKGRARRVGGQRKQEVASRPAPSGGGAEQRRRQGKQRSRQEVEDD